MPSSLTDATVPTVPPVPPVPAAPPAPSRPTDETERRRRSLSLLAGLGILLFLLVLHTFGSVFSHISEQGRGGSSGVWVDAGTPFLILSLVWRGRVPQLDRPLLAAAGLIVGIPTLIHAGLGDTAFASIRYGVGLLLHGVIMIVIYRFWRSLKWRRRPPRPLQHGTWYESWVREWMPTQALDLVALVIASVVGTLSLWTWHGWNGALGAPLTLEALHWPISWGVTTFIGATCTMLILQRPTVEVRSYRVLLLVGLTVVSIVSVTEVLMKAGIPLNWIVVIPSLIAGSVLRPWAAAVHSLGMAAGALAVGNLPGYSKAVSGVIPVSHVVALEVLVAVSVVVTLTLSMLQMERIRLMDELKVERSQASEQAEMLQTVLSGMSDGVVINRPDAEGLEYYNSAAASILRIDLDKWDARSWPEHLTVLDPDGRPIENVAQLRERWRASDEPISVLRITGVVDGEAKNLEMARWVMRHKGNEQVVLMFRDITAQVEREAAMRSFAAVAAHDLRGPLTSLSGWVDLAREEAEPGSDIEQLLVRASKGTDRLRTVIDDWLQYSVTREGQLAAEHVTLAPLVEEVASALIVPSTHPSADGVNSQAQVSLDVSHHAYADPALLRQVLSNLISNGFKYHREGVTPVVAVSSRAEGRDWIRVDVVDNGIGIEPGEEKLIFEMFHRSSGVLAQYSGSGIGLAVCRDIVERHGGKIWARRNALYGTTVSFTIPGCEKESLAS